MDEPKLTKSERRLLYLMNYFATGAEIPYETTEYEDRIGCLIRDGYIIVELTEKAQAALFSWETKN
jgi:hypothetical protein